MVISFNSMKDSTSTPKTVIIKSVYNFQLHEGFYLGVKINQPFEDDKTFNSMKDSTE
ncbi:hypothetical protein Mcup_1077 [Metallosphaera cuprina Ar-4]|uniref:Uncharacterized protein n=1 Tax=Metallosphaera cuprina (strain Ar-4) TaxID=1006006 RepID=F4G2Y4_METCR|nr:hypothetical protein Mcup_1077 [Metallosphaera cuprina Ar-4]